MICANLLGCPTLAAIDLGSQVSKLAQLQGKLTQAILSRLKRYLSLDQKSIQWYYFFGFDTLCRSLGRDTSIMIKVSGFLHVWAGMVRMYHVG